MRYWQSNFIRLAVSDMDTTTNRQKTALMIALSLMLSHPTTTVAKTLLTNANVPPTTSLNSTNAQAMATNSQPMVAPTDIENGSGDEMIDAPTQGNTMPLTIDDGGEVDVGVGQAPTEQVTVPSVIIPSASTANTASPVLSSPTVQAVAQVPLGAVSPETIAKFVKMIDIVRHEYVKPVDDEQLFSNAMTGTLSELDPYSEYLDSEAYNNLKLFTEGDVGSIGVKVSLHPDSKAWVFDEVLPNSPAAKQGIVRGNFLHQINDNKLSDEQTQQDIDQLLSGIAGTQVRLVVSDSGRRKHSITVQRSLVQQQAIEAEIIQGIAVVRIPVFQNNTQQQLLTALTNLNEPFSAIILDIRNNPGGVLSAATDVASLFMPNKTVAQVKNRQGLQEIIKTRTTAQFANVPLAVLQNRYSASAAEVLAMSLQENKRAKIYGETSYGKGSIQSILPINDTEAVKLTVAHYYSGNGKKIDGVGVKPDVALTGNELNWQTKVLATTLLQSLPVRYQLQPNADGQVF